MALPFMGFQDLIMTAQNYSKILPIHIPGSAPAFESFCLKNTIRIGPLLQLESAITKLNVAHIVRALNAEKRNATQCHYDKARVIKLFFIFRPIALAGVTPAGIPAHRALTGGEKSRIPYKSMA